MDDSAQVGLPLWASLLARLVCGLLGAAALGLFGSWRFGHDMMVAGGILGLLSGICLGRRGLEAIAGALVNWGAQGPR